eukprot:1156085-Pelagomonas_calceolata.AAC.2
MLRHDANSCACWVQLNTCQYLSMPVKGNTECQPPPQCTQRKYLCRLGAWKGVQREHLGAPLCAGQDGNSNHAAAFVPATPVPYNGGSWVASLEKHQTSPYVWHRAGEMYFMDDVGHIRGSMRHRGVHKERRGKGCIAVLAYVGSSAEAKTMPVAKPVPAGEEEQNIWFSHSISGTLTRPWRILGHQPGPCKRVHKGESYGISLVHTRECIRTEVSQCRLQMNGSQMNGALAERVPLSAFTLLQGINFT